MKREPVIVSACLLGLACRFDGERLEENRLLKFSNEKIPIPVCPEQMGGLSTPRIPSEINDGNGEDVLDGKARVINKNGEDVTENFVKGAYEVKKLTEIIDIKEAILKSKSPACGFGKIKKDGKEVEGNGVCAALLNRMGIKISSVCP